MRFKIQSAFLRFIGLFAMLTLLLISAAIAQQSTGPLYTIKTESIVNARNGSLVSLTMTALNNTNAPFTGEITLEPVQGIAIAGKQRVVVNIPANSQIFYPVSLIVSNQAPAGETPIRFLLQDSLNAVLATFKTKMILEHNRSVQLIANRPVEMMQNVGDSLKVAVLLSNTGNTKERLQVIATFPDLNGGTILVDKAVELHPFQDSIVVFTRIINRQLLAIEQFSVNIAALYSDGTMVNNVLVNVQNVSGNRKYISPGQQILGMNNFSNNTISLSGRNFFSDTEAWMLNGRGSFVLPTGHIGFNLDAYQWKNSTSRPLVSNTWVDYEFKNKGIVAGNIYESLETFINGRGVKLYAENEAETNRFEVALVDKSNNLLGYGYKTPATSGYTAYAKTMLSDGAGGGYIGSVMYDRAPIDKAENMIIMNNYKVQLNQKLRIGFDLGGGLTRVLDAPTPSSFKPSLAIGSSASGELGQYSLSSSNYYSSGYYPGIKRGALQLDERISRSINKVNIWLAYSHYRFNPQYFQNQYTFSSNFSNSKIEAGTSFPISSRLSLNLSLNKYSEKGNFGILPLALNADMKLDSYRVSETIGWHSENNLHNVYLTAENGISKSPVTGEQSIQIRANASWTYRGFSLNSFFQQGNFSLSEALINAQYSGDNAYRISLSPAYNKSFFRKKMNVQLNVMYTEDSFTGKNWTYAGSGKYAISNRMSVFANAYFYNYKTQFYNSASSTFQAGLIYNLPDTRNAVSQKTGDIKIFLFFDHNTNGIFDTGDVPAVGRIVTIDNTNLITLQDGTIQYRKVPYGKHALSIPAQNWYADVPKIDLQSKELKLSVALQETGKIMGSFVYNYDERLSMEVVERYAGLRLFLSGNNGVNLEVLTNTRGEFTLFAPAGIYEVKVDKNSLPEHVLSQEKTMQYKVEIGKTTVVPVIELEVQKRIIQVKKFSSE